MSALLVYTWPYGIVFFVVMIWAFLPEFLIITRAKEPSSTPQDARSKQFIAVGQGVAVFAAFGIAARVPSAALPNGVLWFWAGLCTIVAGSLLRRHCWRMLGKSFTGAVIVKPDQAVVERGAYRYVRHPSYTAGAIMFLGIGLTLGNWLSAAVMLTAVAIVYAYRVAVEERALVTVLGDPYRLYMARTRRFIPFVF